MKAETLTDALKRQIADLEAQVKRQKERASGASVLLEQSVIQRNRYMAERDAAIGFAIAWHDGKSRSHSERYADHANDRTLAANYAATRLAARLWIEQQGDAK